MSMPSMWKTSTLQQDIEMEDITCKQNGFTFYKENAQTSIFRILSILNGIFLLKHVIKNNKTSSRFSVS